MSQEDTIDMIEELLRSIKTRGMKKTLQILKVDEAKNTELKDPYVIEVLQVVSEHFNVLVDDMVNGRYIRGDYKYAVGFAVYYLYDKMTLGDIHKKIFRNKTKTLLSRYRQMVLELDKSEKVNKKYIDIKRLLDERIEAIKLP